MKKVLVARLCLAQLLYWVPIGAANPKHPVSSAVLTSESPQQLLNTPRITPQQLPVQKLIVFLPAVYRNFDGRFLGSSPAALPLEPLNYHDPIVVLDAGERLHACWNTQAAK